jgi:hypothetical protein
VSERACLRSTDFKADTLQSACAIRQSLYRNIANPPAFDSYKSSVIWESSERGELLCFALIHALLFADCRRHLPDSLAVDLSQFGAIASII